MPESSVRIVCEACNMPLWSVPHRAGCRVKQLEDERDRLREEVSEYRKALSNIKHRLETGPVDDVTLHQIVNAALLLRGLKPYQRDEIEGLRGDSGA